MSAAPPFIVPLALANRVPRRLVGSKAARLGDLLRLQLTVPAGFCVTTSAFEYFLEEAEIAARLHELVRERRASDGASLRVAQELILRGHMPSALRAEIERAFHSQASGGAPSDAGFAVRSSAVDEDMDSESFAGIHHTYLNVAGLDSVLDHVKDCWASFYSREALAYREAHNLAGQEIVGAVIVQEMISADAAGVLFTLDPVSGSRSSLILEAHAGAGEDLVSGAITPQHYVLSRAPLAIVDKHLGGAPGNPTRSVLSDGEILELARAGIMIEDFYGQPQDIEWARRTDGFHFLQTRPVSTAADHEDEIPDPATWTRKGINERFPEPLKPLERSFVAECVFTPGFTRMFKSLGFPEGNGSQVFRSFGGLVYLNKRLIAQSLKGVPEELGVQILERGNTTPPSPPLSLPLLLTAWRLLRIILLTHRDFQWAVPRFLHSSERFRGRSFSEMTLAQLAAELSAMCETIRAIARGHMQSVLSAELLFTALTTLDPRIGPLVPQLTCGAQFNKSLEMSTRFCDLADAARGNESVRKLLSLDDPAVVFDLLQLEPKAQDFFGELRRFLGEFGHRTTMYQLSYPRWMEEPAQLIQLLQNELRMPADSRPRGVNPAELIQLRNRAERLIGGTGLKRLLSWKRLWFRFLLRYTRIYSGMLRENEGFYITMMFPQVKRVLRVMAAQLKEQLVLQDADDIYYLDLQELRKLGDPLENATGLARTLEARKREFHVRSSTDIQFPAPAGTECTASGTGASPGRVSGTALVIECPTDQFIPGSILVTHTLNSSWVPILRSAKGVVTELGGMLSHGAVLAREFHVPAVLGAGSIARSICTGQQITVDGTRGLVYIDRDTGADLDHSLSPATSALYSNHDLVSQRSPDGIRRHV